MACRLFVYGTLKRGERNHGLCQGARFVGPGWLRGRLYAHPDDYPVLELPQDAQDTAWPPVLGEVFELEDSRVLAALDALEGLPEGGSLVGELYQRVKQTVALGFPSRPRDQSDSSPAWVYALAPKAVRDGLRLLDSQGSEAILWRSGSSIGGAARI